MSAQSRLLQVPGADYQSPAARSVDLSRKLDAFKENRDTRFHFATQVHSEALADIMRLIEDADPGFVVVTGEPGCGKTLLRTVLGQQLTEQGCVCVSVESGLLAFDDLLLEILSQLRGLRLLPGDYPDRYSRISAYKDALMAEVVQKERHLAVLLDEAQQMDAETLEGIRSLCNIGAERQNYTTAIFFGQADIRGRIESRPALAARVAMTVHLEPLTLEETSAYLRHRLDVAGFTESMPFSDEALTAMHALTRGVPRSLNRLCKMTIRQSMIRNKRIADASCVHDAAAKPGISSRWPDSCLLSG